jgi:hypothetical protein
MIDFDVLKNIKEIEQTKNGFFTLKIGSNYIHSLYDPYKEAERIIKPLEDLSPERTLVVVFGAGLGYHIELIEKNGFKNVIVIERNKKIFDIFSKIYSLPQTFYLIGPEDGPEKLDSVFSLMEIQNFKNIKTIIFRSTYEKELYFPFENRLERLLKVKLGDFSTRLKFEEIWFINILRNLRFLKFCVPVSTIFNYFKNTPVVLISAGPSLKESLKYLKEIEDYAILISVDTALLPLYEAGINVDFVYSLDSQVYNLGDFQQIDKKYLSKVNFIFDIVANPGIISLFSEIENRIGNNFVATTAHLDFDYNNNPFFIKSEFVNWIEAKTGIQFGNIETGGSVSTSAFHLAYMLGGNPIILVGQDLSFPYMITHTVSSPHYYKFLLKTNRLNSLETFFLHLIAQRRIVEEVDFEGNKILSDFVLHNFKGWFEESAKNIQNFRSDVTLINSTLKGVNLKYFKNISISEISRMIRKSLKLLPLNKIFPVFPLIDYRKIVKIINEIKKLKDFLENLSLSEELFNLIAASEFHFLKSYFMQERIVFDRYKKLEKLSLERKIYRLLKNIEGLYGF